MKGLNKVIFFVFLITFSSAGAKSYKFKNYEEAKESHEYVMFESESTKLGFITTSYDGYAKNYEVKFERDGDVIKDIEVKINTSSLDTDNSSRDEKMRKTILEVKKHPYMIFKSNDRIDLKEGKLDISGKLKVRDIERVLTIKLVIEKREREFYIKGLTSISLKEFRVPDPSIAIASVRDQHDLKFGIKINE
ncbi:hypothetical protein BIY24_03865 [Halobacteriovorax marinus]|uniref:YceI family protein n=1 Tax=Halobacteriovorax marinus TaxID=97084 RepID=UPI000BC329C0|nr:YceI family protein [Halobacteriovorax marinus]ATH07103.1 hypothetical protein BIY24_03865 [Halobacteriovorax marinus]